MFNFKCRENHTTTISKFAACMMGQSYTPLSIIIIMVRVLLAYTRNMYLYGQWNDISVGRITLPDIYKWACEPSNSHKPTHDPVTTYNVMPPHSQTQHPNAMCWHCTLRVSFSSDTHQYILLTLVSLTKL